MAWLNAGNATISNPIKTKVSRMYDLLLFIDTEAGLNNGFGMDYSDNPYGELSKTLLNFRFEKVGIIYMRKMPSVWTSGRSRLNKDMFIGPYIEYGVAPKKYIKYRLNGLTIERYVDMKDNEFSGNNLSYMLLYRNVNINTYLVYGIDLEDNIAKYFRYL